MKLSVDGLVVRLWIYIQNCGCSNPHGVVYFNFIHSKFCKPHINDRFLVYALNFIMLQRLLTSKLFPMRSEAKVTAFLK